MGFKKGVPQLPLNEALVIPQIAALRSLGQTASQIARELKMGYVTVKRLMEKDECKLMVKEISDSYKDMAKASAIKKISELTDLAIEGLRDALKDGNIEAIKTQFRIIGLMGVEDQKTTPGMGSMTIVLPGAHVEKPALEVENEPEL